MPYIRAVLLAALLAVPVFGADRPNVVLISIDTLRADHLPPYGYGVATAPFLSSMADRGIVFEKASVPMPVTTPSHGSMLTGQYPSGHGSLALAVPLNRSVETIAEALQRSGYHTAGAVAVSHIGRVSNFDQGFDQFSDTGNEKIRDGKAVNADIVRFVSDYRRTAAGKPLFLFVHYFDCHAPYGWW
jgi:choline-sulfatase